MKILGLGQGFVDVYPHKERYYAGGCQLNISVYAKMLEKNVVSAFLGVLGRDYAGSFLQDTLLADDIDISHCRIAYGESAMCEIEIIEGERVFIKWDAGVYKNNPLVITNDDVQFIKGFNIVHTSRMAKIDAQLPMFMNRQFILVYDFSRIKLDSDMEYVKTIAPLIDIGTFSCAHLTVNEINTLIKFTHKAGCKFVLVTRGKEGQIFSTENQRFFGCAKIVNTVDTLECGDAFSAAFSWKLVKEGWRRNKTITKEICKMAFSEASCFSANIATLDGAFGIYWPIQKPKDEGRENID